MLVTVNLEAFDMKASILKKEIFTHVEYVTDSMKNFYGRSPKYIIFITICNKEERARVFGGIGNTGETAWRNAIIMSRKYVKDNQLEDIWIKADLVKSIESYSLKDFLALSISERKNYLRKGISFDPFFKLAFLEQEMNANGFIRRDEKNYKDELHLSNINHYMKTYRGLSNPLKAEHIKDVFLFTTYSYFYDDECYELHSGPIHNGRRKIKQVDKVLVQQLIEHSSIYLANQTQPSGRFIYGYFPSFNRQINFYNMLRHASTTYSMIEAYEITHSKHLSSSIERAIEYLITVGIEYIDDKDAEPLAYVVERESENEIKLGANAAAILALTKYSTVFNSEKYMHVMVALANGILAMQDSISGEFIHVLNFPDLTIKDKFRIIYYDGEAAFALMRLYAMDKNDKWLNAVELAFANFINKDYWKHHDHWLSYCTNELTDYKPLNKYFEFGINNVQNKLDFILTRDTTFPTFLELLMAAYKMTRKMKLMDRNELLEGFHHNKMLDAIEHRVKHQLNGFFFPETAMYFKNPAVIVGSFYIRHHSFRCRIDDIEHNLSGYVNYYNEMMNE